MIKKITIKNFQSHENTILNLSKGVNVFIGNTDSGKTSIIRAVKWVLLNTPTGWDFKNHNATFTKVIIDFFDKNKISKFRSSRTLNYRLNSNKFNSGKNLPEEISKVINLSDLNLQEQQDPHFLINNSSSSITKELNKIANLDVIDKFQSSLNKLKLKAQSEIRVYNEQIQELGKVKNTKEIEELVKQYEEIDKKLEQKNEMLLDIKLLMRNIKDKEKQIKELCIKNKNAGNALNKIEALLKQIYSKENEKRRLLNKQYKLLHCINKLDLIRKKIIKLESQYKKLKPKTCPLCGGELL